MGRFKYKLQNILDIKNRLEELAKMEHATAMNVLREEEAKLIALEHRKYEYEEEARLLRSSIINIQDIKNNSNAIGHVSELINEQVRCVEIAKFNREEAFNKLAELMKERKTFDKLKDRAFEDYMIEERAKEDQEIDEVVSYKYGNSSDVETL